MTTDTTIRQSFPNREAWLKGRRGIGASDVGTIIGVGFKTPLQLWREKIGAEQHPDIGSNPRVAFGNAAEDPLRDMFRLMHPEYELSFEPFTILRQKHSHPYLFCTPDGELVEKSTGRRGLYESKTATLLSSADWSRWDGKVPDGYFAQVCSAMHSGNFEFAVIWALLMRRDGDAMLRMYHFERSECADSIDYILSKTEPFWHCVETQTIPPALLVMG